MVKRALVTGAHGFIGRHVARGLTRAGWQVAGIGHGDWEAEERHACSIVEWRGGEVTSENLRAFDRLRLIVHCAGGASVTASLADPCGDFQRTVATTAGILDFSRRQTPPVPVVYPSSVAVHGVAPPGPISEDMPLRSVSPYGLHKSMAEEMCRFYARHWSVPIAVVRFFSVYGPGLRKQLLWDACNKIARGELIFFGTGAEVRDWLHVDDAVSLLIAAADHASPDAPVVNGGTGVGTQIRDVVHTLSRLLGQTIEPQFSGVIRPGDPPRYIADTSRSYAWGWQPRWTLDAGLADYVRWFRTLPQRATMAPRLESRSPARPVVNDLS